MAVADDARRALFAKLVSALGKEEAVTLMDHLPPPGEAAATQADLLGSEARLQQRIQGVEARLDQRIDVLDERIGALDQRTQGRIGALDQRTQERIGELEQRLMHQLSSTADQLRAEVAMQFAHTTRVFVLAVVLSNATIASLAFGAAHLV